MPNHTATLALVQPVALAAHQAPASHAAVLCAAALDACPAEVVARRLDRSADLIRRWGRGQGSPSLVQILQAPERFARRLLVGLGAVYAGEVLEVPLRERAWSCAAALGRLLAMAHGELQEHTDAELEEMARTARQVAEEAQRVATAAERVLQARRLAEREARYGR